MKFICRLNSPIMNIMELHSTRVDVSSPWNSILYVNTAFWRSAGEATDERRPAYKFTKAWQKRRYLLIFDVTWRKITCGSLIGCWFSTTCLLVLRFQNLATLALTSCSTSNQKQSVTRTNPIVHYVVNYYSIIISHERNRSRPGRAMWKPNWSQGEFSHVYR